MWYEGKTGNHQGLVIEEKTGKNIAVTYDKKDAALIVAAPDMLEACKVALLELGQLHTEHAGECLGLKESKAHCPTLVYMAMLEKAIAKADAQKEIK